MTKATHDKRARPAAVELREDALDQAAGGLLSGDSGRDWSFFGDADGNGQVDGKDLAIAKPRT